MEKGKNRLGKISAAALAGLAGISDAHASPPTEPRSISVNEVGDKGISKRLQEKKKTFFAEVRNHVQGRELLTDEIALQESISAFRAIEKKFQASHEEIFGQRSIDDQWRQLTSPLQPNIEDTQNIDRKITLENRAIQLLVSISDDIRGIAAGLALQTHTNSEENKKREREIETIASLRTRWEEFLVLVASDAELHDKAFAQLIEFEQFQKTIKRELG